MDWRTAVALAVRARDIGLARGERFRACSCSAKGSMVFAEHPDGCSEKTSPGLRGGREEKVLGSQEELLWLCFNLEIHVDAVALEYGRCGGVKGLIRIRLAALFVAEEVVERMIPVIAS